MNQDDGPVLHKDPARPNGDPARAHRGRDRGLSLGHGSKSHPSLYLVRNLILNYTFLPLHHKLWSLPKVEFQVVAGTVSAKTDRLEGIVDFTEQQVKVARKDMFVSVKALQK